MLYFALKRQKILHAPAWALLFGYGTFIFVYSGTYFGHLLAGVCLVLSYIAIFREKKYFASGFFLGLGIITEYTLGIIVTIWLIVALCRRESLKNLFYLFLGLLPFILGIMFYNLITTGNALATPYSRVALPAYSQMKINYGFGAPSSSALYGLLISPYRGLFVYAPIFLVNLFLFRKDNFQTLIRNLCTDYSSLTIIVFILAISGYYSWWGGWAFGSRHLIPIAMLLVYVTATKMNLWGRGEKYLAVGLLFIGSLQAWLAKVTRVYMIPDDFDRYFYPTVDLLFNDVGTGKYNGHSIPSFLLGVTPVVSAFSWLLVFLFFLLLVNKNAYWRIFFVRKIET